MEPATHVAPAGELPTTRQLNRATALAAGVAALVLAVAILPAEYGVDPTGVGRVLGLTQMGEVKREAAAESSALPAAADEVLTLDEEPAAATAPAGQVRMEAVRLTLQPDEGREVKATMKAGEQFSYKWSASERVNFELHGEPAGAASSEFTSYEKGSSTGEAGTFRAPFDGTHGWYWRNRTGKPAEIIVSATGSFSKFALVVEQ